MTATPPPRAAPEGFRHELMLWDDDAAYLDRTVPFITGALAEREPVMVAVPAERWRLLAPALGDGADQVQHVDMSTLGRNPARMLPLLLGFVQEAARGGRPLRGIGEPVWVGRRPEEIAECQLHEALVNLAVPQDAPLRLLCPYSTAGLPSAVLQEAARTHHPVDGAGPRHAVGPVEATAPGSTPAAAPSAREHVQHLHRRRLPEPAEVDGRLLVARGGLSAVRALTAEHATAAGLAPGLVADLVLAVNELVANSLDHGGGTGLLRIWRRPDALVLEVSDTGTFDDPLIGRSTPSPHQARGRGLWMVHQLCDLVQVRSTPEGTVTRLLTWL